MSNYLKLGGLVSVAALAATVLIAQRVVPPRAVSKTPTTHNSPILHPELAVEHGTYDKPAATLGEKTTAPWSATTIAAAVAHNPQPGHQVELVGEIVDFSCYLQLGKHGEKHRSCGQKCVQNGQPIGLLTRYGTLYMLMPEEHDPRRDGLVDARPSASEYMGYIVKVIGTETAHRGYQALYVSGLKK
jgi:hypothetical protein